MHSFRQRTDGCMWQTVITTDVITCPCFLHQPALRRTDYCFYVGRKRQVKKWQNCTLTTRVLEPRLPPGRMESWASSHRGAHSPLWLLPTPTPNLLTWSPGCPSSGWTHKSFGAITRVPGIQIKLQLRL